MNNRCVENEISNGSLDYLSLGLGHTQQHLNIHAVLSPTPGCHQVGEGKVKEVVASDTNLDEANSVGSECIVQHALVVGIGLGLRRHSCQWPAMHLSINLLHWQVGAFHNSNLDWRATIQDSHLRPLLQVDHDPECVWKICLKHDPRGELHELGLGKDLLEDRDRHIQVVVFLHVQVDELVPTLDRNLI